MNRTAIVRMHGNLVQERAALVKEQDKSLDTKINDITRLLGRLGQVWNDRASVKAQAWLENFAGA